MHETLRKMMNIRVRTIRDRTIDRSKLDQTYIEGTKGRYDGISS